MTENEELALEVEELNAALELALRQRDEVLAERDADVQAVLAVLAGFDVLRIDLPAPVARRIAKLRARFASRIAALDEAPDNEDADG